MFTMLPISYLQRRNCHDYFRAKMSVGVYQRYVGAENYVYGSLIAELKV